MKKLLLLFVPLVFLFSCKKNNEEEVLAYSCVQSQCVYAYNSIGQQIHEPTYVSLEDCQNDCFVE